MSGGPPDPGIEADALSAPFGGLTPDRILDVLEAHGLVCDGRLLALNSYENRVYQVGLEDETPCVVKFYRPGRWSDAAILEEHRFVGQLAEREIPAVPPLEFPGQGTLLHAGRERFSVFPRQGGHAPELDDPETLTRLGRFIARIHGVGAMEDFRHRPTLDAETFGMRSRAFLLDNRIIPADLEPVYRGVVDQALEGVAHCYRRAGQVRALRLHGDCHGGNVLWTDAGPHFVDFDDTRMGPAIQDLWMLLSGDPESMAAQWAAIREGYEDFRDFDLRELHLIEALRTLRLIHYSAWIARRWHDPAFPMAFPFFDNPRYWEDRILELREQIAVMDEPAIL
ncbi:serine/threonine protein kinase [Thioalkalivibrio thiocyanodenitrificans]|uniref:serine/threonine protein kinase n=1 Tax=Thioalkalivibrio thiocyanodenitrificans TaxID=243063 RepID=UPI000A0492A3|nr:serine/threonine protein kinase [Thioalkalivibrio thiocyanodenitrificans]